MVDHTSAEQVRAADEVEALSERAVIVRMLSDYAVNGGVKLGHGAAQNWATLGLRGTRVMGGGQSAALAM